MRNKIFLSAIVFAAFTTSTFANQCSGDSSYRPQNGHRKNVRNILPVNKATNVKVCAGKSYYDYVQMKKAVQYLNRDAQSAYSYLRFSYGSYYDKSNCTVKIKRANVSFNPKIAASTTSLGQFPRIIRINNAAIGNTLTNQYQIQHVIMHELLHAVGLGHTGRSDYKIIDGTIDFNNTNKRSMMCNFTDPRTYPTRRLNSLDKKALGILY